MRNWSRFLTSFLFVFFALILPILFLCHTDAEAVRIGFFGGLNIANQGGDFNKLGEEIEAELENQTGVAWTVEKKAELGPGFGAFVYLPATPTLGVQIEGQYMRRGCKFELSSSGAGSGDAKFHLDYIEFPVLLRISPPMTGASHFFFVAGPVIGFKTSANLEVSSEGQSVSGDVSEGFKSQTFGALGGIGWETGVGATASLMLQARYYLGLTNVIDAPDFSSKASGFGIFAGLEFSLLP
ncbi:MAG TPA: porin family protein [Candidatus Krumholzibacteria bacterium]|nr:porin family protein [Candidatus Krumholzibacteria bacterium]